MIRLSHAFLIGAIALLLVAMIAFLSGWMVASATQEWQTARITLQTPLGDPSNAPVASDQFDVYWDVWRLVEREFYHSDAVNEQAMVYGSIQGMLNSLGDEYTIFQEPEAADRSRESLQGKFEGIGVYMRVENGAVLIDRPIRGSPAMAAGLLAGDIIERVGEQPVATLIAGLSEPEAMQAVAREIRGPKGTTVRLTIVRPAEQRTFEVDIMRDEVPLISVDARMLDQQVAYIQLAEFKATTTGELDAALRELLPQQPNALVLDLRNNPGGLLTTAQEVLGRFYDGVALYEQLRDGEIKEFRTIRGAADVQVPAIPVVVLINGGSASAAEIVAGALRDQRPQTTLLGETSYGKGSVQNIHQLRDGSSVRITIAEWLTPQRTVIHNVGITPDHVVPPSEAMEYAVPCVQDGAPPTQTCYDAQLAWTLRLLTSGATPPPPPAPTPVG